MIEAISPNQVALSYLTASVLFILALKGLSNPLSARRGNRFGIAGMTLAILTTLAVTRRPRDFAKVYDLPERVLPAAVLSAPTPTEQDARKELLVRGARAQGVGTLGDLTDYHLSHSARAELCRRLGRTDDARASYERALSLTQQEPERRFLEWRLSTLNGG